MAEPTRRRGRPRNVTEPSGSIRALDRALDVLDLLAAHPGLTLSDVVEKTGQTPSSVHRILHTLAARDMAESDTATQAWFIGPATFRLGAGFMRRSNIVERARPILNGLMEHTGESASLAILNENSVLFLSQAETQESIRACFPPGTRATLHASGIGKVLLAFGSPDFLRDYLEQSNLTRFTSNTLTTPKDLRDNIARIRARGFAFEDEERNQGMRSIAAPIYDMTARAVAGIAISGPSHRIGQEHVKTLGATVVAAALELTQALGGAIQDQ